MSRLNTQWIGLAVGGLLVAWAAPLDHRVNTARLREDEAATLSALYDYADRLRTLDGDERLRELQARKIADADSCREPQKSLELALLLSDSAAPDLAHARRLLAGCLNTFPGPLLAAYIRSRLDMLARIERSAREADTLREQIEALEQVLAWHESRTARIGSLEAHNRDLKARVETLENQIKELSSIEKNLQLEAHIE